MQLAIIGAGNVGGTLGRRFAEAGHQVVFGVRDDADPKIRALLAETGARAASLSAAAAGADVVILAVPWMAAADAVAALGDLSGKVLVDATNAVGPGYRPALDPTTSGAETIAALAPGARVVKAFNTVGAPIMAAPDFGGARPAMPICGDDPSAKETVGRLVTDLGFEPLDLGPLAADPLVEAAALLWITLAYRQGLGPTFAFGLLRRG